MTMFETVIADIILAFFVFALVVLVIWIDRLEGDVKRLRRKIRRMAKESQ